MNCTTFDKFNPTRVITTSYDGYVRYFDLCTNISDPVEIFQSHTSYNDSFLILSFVLLGLPFKKDEP